MYSFCGPEIASMLPSVDQFKVCVLLANHSIRFFHVTCWLLAVGQPFSYVLQCLTLSLSHCQLPCSLKTHDRGKCN